MAAATAISQEDSDKFIQAAIDELDKDQGKFAENVSNVAEWAVQVDEGFSNVTYGLKNMYEKQGKDFPALGTYFEEWKTYNQRWTTQLLLSRDVASRHASDLKSPFGFDEVFLTMIQEIKTDQDREDAIKELGQFANEDHTESENMAPGFTSLKADIERFVVRFDGWVKETRTELKEQAYELKQKIEELTTSIEALDKEIAAATAALLASAAAAGTMVGIIGLIVTGTVLAIMVATRIDKTIQISDRQKELAEVNRKQQALAQVKTQFDGLKPDIALICSRLALFGEIRAQSLKFQETLNDGMETVTNERFKKEVQLARKLCRPLRNGLEKYATQLAGRK
ncbi:hypothetical protein FS749_000622 [Ceratobasidium sp. UAMH 11750]|nr:hypothetical protein FS749_000622 [Ceratobasidium sp. UAMH 11750]